MPLPWERDDDDDEESVDDYSPASPPLMKSTEREETSPPPTLYVLPNAIIVVPTHNEPAVYIPDRGTDTTLDEKNPQVCDVMIEEAVANLIAYNWRRSVRTLDEVASITSQDITATIMSPEWQEQVKEYVRATIRDCRQ